MGKRQPLHRWRAPSVWWDKLKPLARQKRHKPTEAEDYLWQELRNRKVAGVKFRRQAVIERFIVDFYAARAGLVVEVDGSIHDYTPEEDAIRREFIESMGIRVLRFRNEEVVEDIESVLEKIGEAVGSEAI